ncbi:Scr1 family TA system antitoxin-like transcriptional regulator [Streptomyces sp. NPDC001404]|uniref:helix-turn-helix domain-containing protein n=1 Tax=Streptomyces sp. NPDC001404 TaxID=3364571 RepID=UPI00367C5151
MSVETVDPTEPAVSPLAHFGTEVRLERERLGLSREELGKAAHCGYSLVAKIEAGQRVPSIDFAETCDQVFPHAHGRFERLCTLVLRFAFPPWFRKYVELEEVATHIRMFQCQVVPGLVQTEEYARAIMATGRVQNAEDLVTARMARQRILRREKPPRVWIVLDEDVLRRVVGGKHVMKGQLERLRDVAGTPPHVVQVIPDDGRPYHGWSGPFGLLSFSEGSDVVRVEGFPREYLVGDQQDVAVASDAFDLLMATALSPDESAALINSVLKERYS